MKHGIIGMCQLSTGDHKVQNRNLYRFVSRSVTRKELELYLCSRKHILSNLDKIPKSLQLRLCRICPSCMFLQCFCKRNISTKTSIKCKNCGISFLQTESFSKNKIRQWLQIKYFCKECKNKLCQILSNYIRNRVKTSNALTTAYKHNIVKCFEHFKYRIRVKEENLNLTFPASFLWTSNLSMCNNISKMLQQNVTYTPNLNKTKKQPKNSLILDIKPDPISFIGRGKVNCFRKYLLNKRTFNSSRSVIIPAPFLKTNETILNKRIWTQMGCPAYVLGIRYPVIDTRAFCFFKVISTWDLPVIGIPPTVTDSTVLDYDGDALNCYAIKRATTVDECDKVLNPENSFVSMGEIRVNLTHDELEVLYNLFGINRVLIYNLFFKNYLLFGSHVAFTMFENLRKSLINLNRLVKSTVSYEMFCKLLEIFLVHQLDIKEFKTVWDSHGFTRNCIFSRYIGSNADRWKYETLSQMIMYLKGMTKIQYIVESFQCRTALSKAGVEITGYITHKLSYILHELWLNNDLQIYYGSDRVAYRSVRRLLTPVNSQSFLRMYSLYKIINRNRNLFS